MQLPGLRNIPTGSFDFSGSITTGGTAQLLLPQQKTRSYLLIQNTSDTAMTLGIGPARATAALTSGAVSSFTVTNAGFGYTYPPLVNCRGGSLWNTAFVDSLSGGFDCAAPANEAQAYATLTANAVSAVTVQNGGSGYGAAPYVELQNDPRDPFGCFLPSATAGLYLAPNGGTLCFEDTTCVTDAVSVFCATTGKTFVCLVVP